MGRSRKAVPVVNQLRYCGNTYNPDKWLRAVHDNRKMAIPRLNPLFKNNLYPKTWRLPLSQCLLVTSSRLPHYLPGKLSLNPVFAVAAANCSTSPESDLSKENSEIEHWPSRRELVDTLNGQVEGVLRHLKLEPNYGLSGPDQIRVGSKGSLSIVARTHEAKGRRCNAGTWYNFETEEKGDMLTLVGKQLGLQGKHLYRHAVTKILPDLKDMPSLPNATLSSELPGYSKLEDLAARILEESDPITNTLAEEYLRSRGLTELSSSALFYHPALITRTEKGEWLHNIPGLVVAAGNPKSPIMNIQVTYLEDCGKKHKDVVVQRRTIGTFQDPLGYHSCLLSPGDSTLNGFTFVAEGTETALSVLQVLPGDRVVATLGKGNLARIDPDLLTKRVVLVLDNDGTSYKADSLLLRAATRLLEAGKMVYVVWPDLLPGTTKTDMNDVLQHQGEDAVYLTIKKMKQLTL